MNTELMNKATRTLHKAGFQLKKHSPEILAVAGVIGTVSAAVMACKATTKLGGIIDKTKEDLDAIHAAAEHPETLPEEYTPEDAKKDLAIVYIQTGVKIVKLYGPAVALGALSLTGMLTSNHILRKRNIALAAAYATVDKSFKAYRGRVVERFGEELDKELRYNIKAKEVKETVVDENGKKKTVKTMVNVTDPNTYSEYARCFMQGSTGWDKDPEFRLMFLKSQQNAANERLKARGYLFLNEVYEMLDIPPTKAGACVGWIYDEKHAYGDNFVDFGIYNVNDPNCRNFVDGTESAIWLDFNVDGYILDNL